MLKFQSFTTCALTIPRSPEECQTAVDRIYTCNHPSLGADNKRELEVDCGPCENDCVFTDSWPMMLLMHVLPESVKCVELFELRPVNMTILVVLKILFG